MKILIGWDGSESGEAIINDLEKAGLPNKSEVVVLTVADVRDIPTSPFLAQRISSQIEHLFSSDDTKIQEKLDKHLRIAEADALKAIKRLKEIYPGWQISTVAVYGKPARELITKADEWKPDILIVGSHGRTAVGRFLLGSVSHKVLHEAHCSVRISRRISTRKNSKTRVLLAVDGSPHAEAVAKNVANRVWAETTEFCLVAVDDPFNRPEMGYLNWDQMEDRPIDNEKSREWIEKVINKPSQLLESVGLEVSRKIIWGDAANMILQEAEDWKADAIFLGARGIGPVKRFLLGSVSSTVAAQAECTVEVIRI